MSDSTMKAAIVSMLPKGAAWEIAPDGELDHLLDAIGDGLEDVREDVGQVGKVRDPETTALLDDLEVELGIVPEPDISEASRRAYLKSVKYEKPKTGSDDHLEALLVAAGFDVIVLRNDPPVDPASVLQNEPNATCGDPAATCGDAETTCGYSGLGELLVNGDSVTEQEPLYTATCGDSSSTCGDADTTCGTFDSMRREYYSYPIPSNPARWPFFFWVCGGVDGFDDLIDWNMEMSGSAHWPGGGVGNVSKSMSVLNSGIRSLRVGAGGEDLSAQKIQPDNPDADLQSFYRMDDVGAGVIENLAWLNELVDGNMEKPGTDVIVDGDMEVTGPDVIVDGDMEVTGPDVIVDGDMEAVGVAAWTAGNAVLTKQGSPHSGTQCLRAAQTIAAISAVAYQSILTIAKTYRIKGWARSDGTLRPQVRDGSQTFWTGTISTSWQEFDIVGISGHAFLQLRSVTGAGGIGAYVEFDDVEVIDETVACAAYTAAGAGTLLSKQGDAHGGAQCMRVEYGAAANGNARQVALTIGKTYRIKGWARGDGGGTVFPRVYESAILWDGTNSTSWQEFDVVFVAVSTTLRFYNYDSTGAGEYVEFDDIEVIDETVACAAWTAHNSALLSKQEDAHEAAQCLRVEYNGVAFPSARQIIITIGKTYRIKGWCRGDGSNFPSVYMGGAVLFTGSISSSWQYFDEVHLATATNVRLYNQSSGGYVEFDDVYVIDLDAGASDYTNAGNTVATKREESPQSGQRCLRVTNAGTIDYVKPAVDVLVIGNDFHITGYARGSGTAFPWLRDGGGPNIWGGTTSTDWQEIDITITAAAVDLRFYCNSANDYVEFDQMMVNAIPASVPTLGADATNANGTNVITPWIKGIEFDGATAKIDANAVNLVMSMENMTMIGWFNLADYTTPATQGLITNGSVGADRQGLYIDAGLIRYVCVSGSAKIIDTGVTLQYQERWRTRIGVTRTYDGAETVIKLYVNGVEKDTLTFRGAPDVTLTQAWIGWLTGASFLDGIASDNVSLFNSGKSAAYMLADYEDGADVMLKGPYAEQIPPDPITTARPLNGYAWGDVETATAAIPMIYVLDTLVDLWRPIWIGATGTAKQTISEELDNIGGIRLYCKGVEKGAVFFDDISISEPVFTLAEIPWKLRDKFRKLVLKAKRLGTYAGLLINWTGDAP